MNSDCTYYQEYFNTINLEKLSFQRTKKTMRALQEEINSTIYPREKMTYQELIYGYCIGWREPQPVKSRAHTS